MKTAIELLLLAAITLSIKTFAQETSNPLRNAPSCEVTNSNREHSADSTGQQAVNPPAPFGVAWDQSSGRHRHAFAIGDKMSYYLTETFLNPSVLSAPAFLAGIRMARPPTQYPSPWRQGAEAFGRNYGDAFAERLSFYTARSLTGIVTKEDPRYEPSSSRNKLARSFHALTFTFIDRSDTGRPMPAVSNFAGAVAGGFVGNMYLPSGFNNLTHAGQRATIRLGFAVGGNLFREFAPQMPSPVRTFFMLFAR